MLIPLACREPGDYPRRIWAQGIVNPGQDTSITTGCHTHLHTMNNLEMPVTLQLMSLDLGRNPEYLEEPLKHRENIHTAEVIHGTLQTSKRFLPRQHGQFCLLGFLNILMRSQVWASTMSEPSVAGIRGSKILRDVKKKKFRFCSERTDQCFIPFLSLHYVFTRSSLCFPMGLQQKDELYNTLN